MVAMKKAGKRRRVVIKNSELTQENLKEGMPREAGLERYLEKKSGKIQRLAASYARSLRMSKASRIESILTN